MMLSISSDSIAVDSIVTLSLLAMFDGELAGGVGGGTYLLVSSISDGVMTCGNVVGMNGGGSHVGVTA